MTTREPKTVVKRTISEATKAAKREAAAVKRDGYKAYERKPFSLLR
jgi:hypothetical protein